MKKMCLMLSTIGVMRPLRSNRSMTSMFRALLIASMCWSGGWWDAECRATELQLTVTPAGQGEQFVRTSVPCPPGFLTEDVSALNVSSGEQKLTAGVRVLTWHAPAVSPVRSVRRLLVSFPWNFRSAEPETFLLSPADEKIRLEQENIDFPVTIDSADDGFLVKWNSGKTVRVVPKLPRQIDPSHLRKQVVEEHGRFRWFRFFSDDSHWPCVAEFRISSLGEIVCIIHLQRIAADDGFAPEIGWALVGEATHAEFISASASRPETTASTNSAGSHSFVKGDPAVCDWNYELQIYHPMAPLTRRGEAFVKKISETEWQYTYIRCHEADRVPMQAMAWRKAELVIAPRHQSRLTVALRSPHHVSVEDSLWSKLFGSGVVPREYPVSAQSLIQYHRDAVVKSGAVGDDAGNVTYFLHGQEFGGPFGMNRLNHCAAIFEDGWRSGDTRLTETALLWCDNFYDLSVWWGQPLRGGTRYNNLNGLNKTPPTKEFMWRSNSAVHFCTKGYDSFWLAWEETGDPRMHEVFRAQVAYAAESLHADRGECRNIGDVRDFVRLYGFTGEQHYLDEALRLFRELRTKLSPDFLFDQGGKPIDPDPPFIDDDDRGLTIGYAKPYILGYALSGLPELLRYAPDEPALRETVHAVADFMAASADPSGGWRYPHARSGQTLISFGPEPAWQLCQAAAALGPEPRWLDAIELVLRARLLGFQRTGTILSSLDSWERSTGKIAAGQSLHDLYQKPGDRDPAGDYDDGRINIGYASPEGTVYLPEVLAFYLQHRSMDRLLEPPATDDPLARILARVPISENAQ